MPKHISGNALLENARVQFFIDTVRSQCRKCNVKFILADAYAVGRQGKGDLWGYFQEPFTSTGGKNAKHNAGVLKIATRDIPVSEWICTLAHEYAHFLQWFRSDPLYSAGDDEYLKQEIETEREAFRILKRFGIPINYDAAKRKSQRYIAKLKKDEKKEN